MKLAISSYGTDLNSQIDPRFGRCAYYLVVDSDNMSFEVFKNESATLGGGAGIQSAQFLAAKGANAVITGNCGPNAVETLAAAGIELFGGQTGTVTEAVAKYKDGRLKQGMAPNVASHFGAGGGVGAGRGGGMGQRMGRGRGMGRGRS
ncbi:MAG: NifB/NifX family molybdenum-iron cluster-binding protein [Desulfobacterales bacterium]|nr:MAG: NifB/NifX family molybdenum-iron cluster-binding protein [Desulfobacterales bacterium]